jgi:hypothetical protein
VPQFEFLPQLTAQPPRWRSEGKTVSIVGMAKVLSGLYRVPGWAYVTDGMMNLTSARKTIVSRDVCPNTISCLQSGITPPPKPKERLPGAGRANMTRDPRRGEGPADEVGNAGHVMRIMVEVVAPKPGKRGPYKKMGGLIKWRCAHDHGEIRGS